MSVHLPRLLEPAVGKVRTVWVEGDTVNGAVDDLLRRHPQLRVHLFDEERRLRPHVLCFVDGNGTLLEMDAPLPERAEIIFLQAVSGGGL